VSSRQAKYLLATKNQSGIGRGLRSALSGRDCTRCSSRSQCARSKQEPRIIKLRTRDLHETLQAMRNRQTTEEFRKSYAPRAGIESSHAQPIRRRGLRRTRYRGLVKTRLQHVTTAVAINLLQIASGQAARRLPRHAAPTSRLSNFMPSEFAASVNVGSTLDWCRSPTRALRGRTKNGSTDSANSAGRFSCANPPVRRHGSVPCGR
jgi:Transposase DDE domain